MEFYGVLDHNIMVGDLKRHKKYGERHENS